MLLLPALLHTCSGTCFHISLACACIDRSVEPEIATKPVLRQTTVAFVYQQHIAADVYFVEHILVRLFVICVFRQRIAYTATYRPQHIEYSDYIRTVMWDTHLYRFFNVEATKIILS